MIRTLAGPRHPSGHHRPHGIHDGDAAQGRRPGGGRFRLRPRARAVQNFQGQGGGAGHRRPRPRLQNHQQFLGRHRRRRFAGVSRGRGTAGHGIHPVSSHRHGLAAERHGHAGDRKRARRGRRVAEQGRQAVHVRRHPGELQVADLDRSGGRLALHAERQKRHAVRRNC